MAQKKLLILVSGAVRVKICDSDRSWLAFGITPDADFDRDPPVPWLPDSLDRLASVPDLQGVLVVNPRLRSEFAASASGLLRAFDLSVPTIVVLLASSVLPKVSASEGEPVFSFMCSAGVFRDFW